MKLAPIGRVRDVARAKKYDKFYTNDDVAAHCLSVLERYLDPDTILVEPAAGAGAFLRATSRPIFGYDVAPDSPLVTKRDFIRDGLSPVMAGRQLAVVGNPPFGTQNTLAREFINRSFDVADTVAFILPYNFSRWHSQHHIDWRARLVHEEVLAPDSFTFCDDDYSLKCVFQIWTLRTDWPDLRIKSQPVREHADFAITQYMPDSPKTLDRLVSNDWHFAVTFANGHHNVYRAFRYDECNLRRKWMMLRARSVPSLHRLFAIDFEGLAKQSRSIIGGFAREDVVAAYSSMN